MIYTSGGGVTTGRGKRTAGDQAVTNTAGVWTAVDTTTDITLSAAAGDEIEIDINLLTSGTSNLDLDVVTVVGGNPLHFVSSDGGAAAAANGLTGLYFDGTFRKSTGFDYVVQAGDLTNGQITLRLVYRCGVNAGTIYGSANYPLIWHAVNFKH